MGFIEITGKRSEGGSEHEHIVAVRTVDRQGREVMQTPGRVLAWLEDATNVAVVYTADRRARFIVGAYRAADGRRCLRAYTQRGWEDHLLRLPELESVARDGGLSRSLVA